MILRPDRRRALALMGAALAAPALARGAPPLTVLSGHAFATTWRVALPDGAPTDGLPPRIAALLAGIDREMSPWRPDGDVARFNRAPVGTHALPATAGAVARAALTLAEASGGAFDPTVGPRVAAWGFGPIDGAATGWCALRWEGDALRKAHPGATLDLCGIAKGHAVDAVTVLLREAGHAHALVEIGGDLRAIGHHPEGRPWRAGVEDPRPGAPGLAATVALSEKAVATSGTRWNGRGSGAARIGHVIDPRTADPVADAPASVSVRARDATAADGWATALMAAGAQGPALARARGFDALFLWAEPKGLRRDVVGDAAWS